MIQRLTLILLLTIKIQVQGASVDVSPNIWINESFIKNIPRDDVLGPFVTMVDKYLSESNRGVPPPKSENCNTRLLKFGENEVKISNHPRGYCSYCCQLPKPSRYVRLYFSNKSTGNSSIEIRLLRKQGLLQSFGVKTNVTTVFFIHGFTEHGLGPAPIYIRDAYLNREEDYNIFLVDWGELSAFPWYPQAAFHTKLLGNLLAKFIDFYDSTGELPIQKIHVIGFSLGAHAAGFIGKYLKQNKLPRITALDPALPMFPIDDIAGRVSIQDAEFVDVIHTDGGKFGFPISIGHADFYPNGGSFIQPGCGPGHLAENRLIEQLGSCGHIRAWKLYGESVRNPNAFPSTQSNMKENHLDGYFKFTVDANMGYGVNTSSTKGNFYLLTNGNAPYSKTATDQENLVNKVDT